MSVDLVRIDDRLVHGQVVEGWVRSLRLERLVVASDEVAADDTQMALYSLAVPQGVELVCLNVEAAARQWKIDVWKNGRTMILVSGPQDVLRLLDAGAPLESVNVGGMHFREGREQVLKAISVDEDDVHAFHRLCQEGIVMEARPLPLDEPIDLRPYVERWTQSREFPR